jgi:hypothetical protein
MVRIHARQVVDSKRLTHVTPGGAVQSLSSPYLVSRRTRDAMDADEPFERVKSDALGLRQTRFDEGPSV